MAGTAPTGGLRCRGVGFLVANPKYLSQQRASTVAWLCLGYPILALAHGLVCVAAWLLVFLIPVAKLSARTAARVLLLPPERVHVRRLRMVGAFRAVFYFFGVGREARHGVTELSLGRRRCRWMQR